MFVFLNFQAKNNYIVTILRVCDYRRDLGWWLDLLATYAHHSERHVITALSLIYTLVSLVCYTLH
jgi:hypothetical protein